MSNRRQGRPPNGARFVACPTCYVPPGAKCVRPNGQELSVYHFARYEAAGVAAPDYVSRNPRAPHPSQRKRSAEENSQRQELLLIARALVRAREGDRNRPVLYKDIVSAAAQDGVVLRESAFRSSQREPRLLRQLSAWLQATLLADLKGRHAADPTLWLSLVEVLPFVWDAPDKIRAGWTPELVIAAYDAVRVCFKEIHPVLTLHDFATLAARRQILQAHGLWDVVVRFVECTPPGAAWSPGSLAIPTRLDQYLRGQANNFF